MEIGEDTARHSSVTQKSCFLPQIKTYLQLRSNKYSKVHSVISWYLRFSAPMPILSSAGSQSVMVQDLVS